MSPDWFERISSRAFDATAFSILGLLFVARPTTLIPTLILLLASVAIFLDAGSKVRLFNIISVSPYRWIVFSFIAWFGISLLLALIHQAQEKFYFPENPMRMVMAITLLVMVAKSSAKQWLFSGVIMGGIASIYWALQALPWTTISRAQGTTNNPIHFGNLSAIIMMLSLTAALLATDISSKIRTLLIVASFGGLIGALASLSRSSFVVLLCVLPMLLFAVNVRSFKWLRMGAAISVITLCVALLMSSSIRDSLRVTDAIVDVQQIHEGNYMSSLGARAVMWQASWNIFKEHPITGVGAGQFQSEIVRRIAAGEIPNTEVHNQPHSDIMHAMSTGGVLMLLSYFGILVAPFLFFYRSYNKAGNIVESRLMPIMGMQVVGAYFLTGLTNSNFDLQIYSTTYAVLVCVLAKLCMQPESTS